MPVKYTTLPEEVHPPTALPTMLNITREQMAHNRFSKAMDTIRKIERQLAPAFEELRVSLEEQEKVNGCEIKPKLNPYMTEAYREFLVKRQVAIERTEPTASRKAK